MVSDFLSVAAQGGCVGVAVAGGAESLDVGAVEAVATQGDLVEAAAATAVGECDKGGESEFEIAGVGIDEVCGMALDACDTVALDADAVAREEEVDVLVGDVAAFFERVVVAEEEDDVAMQRSVMQGIEPSQPAGVVAAVGMDGHMAHNDDGSVVAERVDPSGEAARGRLGRDAEGVGNVDAVVGFRATGARRHGVGSGAVGGGRRQRGRRGGVVALFEIEVDGDLRQRVGGKCHLGVADAIDVVAVAAVRAAEEGAVALGAAAVVRAVSEQQFCLHGVHYTEHLATDVLDREGRLACRAVVGAAAHIVATKQHSLRQYDVLVGGHELQHGCEVVAAAGLMAVGSHEKRRAVGLALLSLVGENYILRFFDASREAKHCQYRDNNVSFHLFFLLNTISLSTCKPAYK